ncbi:MAG TPA: DNA primase [Ktedonobacteraceae bacterium]|nr:DNA primase [Ktedonobacteraceae bacterium]
MTSLIETIKAKVDLVEEIGLVVALHKSGKSFKGHCPFHNERTPSFYVFVESQTWRCFGCHEGGDIFTFVEKQQGLEFWDVLLYLAEKAGVSVDEQRGRDPQEERETHAQKERLRQLNEAALLWFHQGLLRSREAASARAYLQERGINSESVLTFSLGYAPDRWDGLSSYLLGQGYTEHELIMGGLAREREQETGKLYDYFRQRLIFPIRDTRGRVIGFGGRILGEGQPKYLNSPQTLLFEKNNVLYALDMAREAIKQEKQVIIVEGYVDAIIAHQYGTKQTVACIGSAITEKHIQQLKKLTRQVTLALDPDAAGAAATEHGIQEALKGFDRTVVPVPMPALDRAGQSGAPSGRRRQEPQGIIRLEEQVDAEINVLQLPAGEDPDEVIKRDFAAWEHAVKNPLPLIDYYFAIHTTGLNLREAAGQTEAARLLLPVVALITDRVKRDAYLRQLARLLRMDERSLNEDLQHILRGQPANSVVVEFSDRRRDSKSGQNNTAGKNPLAANEQKGEEQSRRETKASGLDSAGRNKLKWEDYLLGLLLQNPGLSEHVCGIINDGDFAGTDTRELYRIFNSMYQRGSSPLHQSLEMAVPAALQETVERVRKCVEVMILTDDARLVKDARQCAIRLKRARLLQSETELRYLLKEAEDGGDVAAERLLRHRVVAVARELRTIDSAIPLHG